MATARNTFRQLFRRAEGFSLVEMLIALYLLAVGLILSAALFPAAVRENQNSSNYTIGTLICQNATSMAKVRLAKETSLQGINESGGTSDVNDPNILMDCSEKYFGPADMVYPAGEDPNKTQLRFRMLARKVKADADNHEYNLIFLSFRKLESTNSIELTPRFGVLFYESSPGKYERDKLDIHLGKVDQSKFDPNDIRVGAPVFAISGSYATILRIDNKIATLSCELVPSTPTDSGLILQTILEYDNGIPPNIVQSRSPIMAVTQTKITLKP